MAEAAFGHRSRVTVAKNSVRDKAGTNTKLTGGKSGQRRMTKIAILPEPSESGAVTYRAIAGARNCVGRTAGEALDSLTAALPAEESGTLVVVQHRHPDRFFTAAQQERLQQLMARWRAARAAGTTLPAADQVELDALIEAEVQAASERAAALLRAVEG